MDADHAGAIAPHCVGVSMPRSGHSFLRRTLIAYFRDDMAFCVGEGNECCRARPCPASRGKRLWYQKNHDFDLTLDSAQTAPWLFYIVQDRHPLPQVLSRIEQREDDGVPFRPDHHLDWLAHRLVYRRRFTEKWLRDPRPDILLLRYEDLVADPAARIAALLRHVTGGVDAARLDRALARVSPFRAGRKPYSPRDIRTSRHFDAALHGAFEAIALAECTIGPYTPMLDHGPVAPDHPLMLRYRILLAEPACPPS